MVLTLIELSAVVLNFWRSSHIGSSKTIKPVFAKFCNVLDSKTWVKYSKQTY